MRRTIAGKTNSSNAHAGEGTEAPARAALAAARPRSCATKASRAPLSHSACSPIVAAMAARQAAILRSALIEVRTISSWNAQGGAITPGERNAEVFTTVVTQALAEMRDVAHAALRGRRR